MNTTEVIAGLEAPSKDRLGVMRQLEEEAPHASLVGASAADALGKIMLAHGPDSVPGAGPALLAAYDAEDRPGPRHMFAAALGAARHREAIPLLRAAAGSEDRGLALAAHWALEQLG